MPYSTIVVGTDGSATASEAVRHAARLAQRTKARLVVVTAFEPLNSKHEADRAPDEIRWMLTDQADAEELARAGRALAYGEGATDVVVQAVRGAPADLLLDTAATFGADLIVVGSVGLAGTARFVLGSVASSVSHHAPCDVLVVHTA